MVQESFIVPTDYKKWFKENELFCDTGVLLNKFLGNSEINETIYDLNDCLKEFFVLVKNLFKDWNYIYEHRYLMKPLVNHLLHLKQSIYFHLRKLLDNSKAANKGKFFGSDFIDFDELIKTGLVSEDEVALIRYSIVLVYSNLINDLDIRELYITTDFAEDSPELYFSIKENTHVNMDISPQYVLDAPFEIESGLINFKFWVAYELYRLFKMTEICCKIVSEKKEIEKSILANSFDAKELISVFESLLN